MATSGHCACAVEKLAIPLERDIFIRNLLRELTGLLEDMIGLDEASGFISVVGQTIGSQINSYYVDQLQVPKLDRKQVANVLLDLKRRINGNFSIEKQDDSCITLTNTACPFGDKVKDRPSLCMMTSNVFGVIAADNLGYARVVLEETIARGDEGCRVQIYLKPQDDSTDSTPQGREYFGADI